MRPTFILLFSSLYSIQSTTMHDSMPHQGIILPSECLLLSMSVYIVESWNDCVSGWPMRAYMHAALLGPYFPLFKVIFKSSWITYEMTVSLYTLNASGEYGQYWVALFWKVTPYVTRLQPLQSNLLRDSFTEKSKTIPLWFSFSWGIHSSGDHYPNAKSNK